MQIASTMNTSRIDVGFKQMVGPVGYRRSVQIDVVRACAILLVMGAHLRFEEPDGIMGSIAWAWHEWGGFAPERWAQAGFGNDSMIRNPMPFAFLKKKRAP